MSPDEITKSDSAGEVWMRRLLEGKVEGKLSRRESLVQVSVITDNSKPQVDTA